MLAKKSLVRYAEENLSISEEFFRKAQIRYNVGEGTNIEQLTAKVQLSEAKNKLDIAINEFKTSSAELNYSLGYRNDAYASAFNLTDSLIYNVYSINLATIYTMADSLNPQIQIAKLNSSIASVEKSIAWSSLLPNFNLAYFKQSRDGIDDFYGASLGISVPLWFLFDQRGAIQEASANESISEASLIQTKNEISLLVKNAFTEYTKNMQQLKIYIEDILPQAEEVYRTAVKSYDAGELSYLEFMLSKQMLINARESSVNALFNYNKSIASLEEIIGINLNELEN
jgi:outer membrane protein TolC